MILSFSRSRRHRAISSTREEDGAPSSPPPNCGIVHHQWVIPPDPEWMEESGSEPHPQLEMRKELHPHHLPSVALSIISGSFHPIQNGWRKAAASHILDSRGRWSSILTTSQLWHCPSSVGHSTRSIMDGGNGYVSGGVG